MQFLKQFNQLLAQWCFFREGSRELPPPQKLNKRLGSNINS